MTRRGEKRNGDSKAEVFQDREEERADDSRSCEGDGADETGDVQEAFAWEVDGRGASEVRRYTRMRCGDHVHRPGDGGADLMTESELIDMFLREQSERYKRERIEDDLVEPLREDIMYVDTGEKSYWILRDERMLNTLNDLLGEKYDCIEDCIDAIIKRAFK